MPFSVESLSLFSLIAIFLSAITAGAINSVAGGGSLISFPILIASGVPSILANATNNAATFPGSIGSIVAYREDALAQRGLLIRLLIPSIVGAALGAVLLLGTSNAVFNRIVPFLVLFATLLFASQQVITRLSRKVSAEVMDHRGVSRAGNIWGILFQLAVSIYGGYFGAGIGILMLASLSIMGLRDIHRMNAIKVTMATVINGVALAYFIIQGRVVLPIALLMAVGGLTGGYLGARYAKRVPQNIIRGFVIVAGLTVSLWLLVRPL